MASAVVMWCALTGGTPTLAAPQASSGAAATAVAQELEGTERRLYDAVRRMPRDARARLALGDWLASRGQLRSGAVLLEEARLFGADASVIAGRLRHLYFWLRDWSSLAALPASPLTTDEKARVAVLAQRAATHSGADSTVVPFAPLEVGALGRIPVVLGADTVWGEVDPLEEGLVLPGLGRGAGLVEVYGAAPRGVIGVVREMGVGDLQLRDVPVRIDPSLGVGRARLGLDVFASLAPTVDARAGTVVLRRDGRARGEAGADAIPFVLGYPGLRLMLRPGEAPVPITAPAGRAALRGSAWTLDLRRGVIWRRPTP